MAKFTTEAKKVTVSNPVIRKARVNKFKLACIVLLVINTLLLVYIALQ